MINFLYDGNKNKNEELVNFKEEIDNLKNEINNYKEELNNYKEEINNYKAEINNNIEELKKQKETNQKIFSIIEILLNGVGLSYDSGINNGSQRHSFKTKLDELRNLIY